MEDFNMVIMLSAGEIPEFTHLLPPPWWAWLSDKHAVSFIHRCDADHWTRLANNPKDRGCQTV